MPTKKEILKHQVRKISKWRATKDSSASKNSWYIRRTVYLIDQEKPVQQRMDAKKYSDIKNNKEKIDEFLTRVNYELEVEKKANEKWNIKSAYVKSTAIREEFFDYLLERTGNKIYSKSVISRFKNHAYDFFDANGLLSFKEWHMESSQKALVDNLKMKGLSVKTIKAVKDSLNIFFQFMYIETNEKVPKYKFSFSSLNTSGTRKYEKRRRDKQATKDRRLSGEDYIAGDTFKRIIKAAGRDLPGVKPSLQPKQFISCFLLAYYYGLRRAETLGVLRASDIKNGHLEVTKQRVAVSRTAELKWGLEEKKIPHYYTTGLISSSRMKKNLMKEYCLDDVSNWIETAPNKNPNDITKSWSCLMDSMKLNFTLHNLRNTYISNLFRDMSLLGISLAEISLAAGHKDLRTSQQYLRDFRPLEDGVYKPKKAA